MCVCIQMQREAKRNPCTPRTHNQKTKRIVHQASVCVWCEERKPQANIGKTCCNNSNLKCCKEEGGREKKCEQHTQKMSNLCIRKKTQNNINKRWQQQKKRQALLLKMNTCSLACFLCVCVRTTEERQIKNSKKGVTTAHNRSPF